MNALKNRKELIILLVLSLFFLQKTLAQDKPCLFDELLDNSLVAAIDQHMTTISPSASGGGGGSFILPIVVHIMHDNGEENISNQQVYEAVARANSQLAGVAGGVDVQIELRLAQIDPDGNCTTGITRTQLQVPDVDPIEIEDDIAFKDNIRWPVDNYLNVWIARCILPDPDCSDDSAVLGYSYFPGADPRVDGIVITHRFFGTSGVATENISNTLVHELGHYLGLAHVWGPDFDPVCGSNGKCHEEEDCETAGDRVCDTAPCRGPVLTNSCEDIPPFCEGLCPNFPVGVYTYPKSNYMSYTHACQNKFTEGQAERMHIITPAFRPVLLSEANLISTGVINAVDPDPVIISSDETWTVSGVGNGGVVDVDGELIVASGAKLTVEENVTIRFNQNGALIVEPNAELNLNGTLSSQCGRYWQGVEVWGDNGQSQFPVGGTRAQGRFIGKDKGVIENALTAIKLYGPDENSAGGQISCGGTTFQNNSVSIEFKPYDNFWPYATSQQGQPRSYFASFADCTFLTNDDYILPDIFRAFVDMSGVNGIRFYGCSFTNESNIVGASSIADYGYGIIASESGFNLGGLCTAITAPCPNYQNNSFTGLGYGIEVTNIGSMKPYTVTQSNFNRCYFGLYNSGVSNGTILYNNFNMGEIPNSSITNDQIGVFLEMGLNGFTFQENNFVGIPGSSVTTIGSYCRELGAFNNQVRRNFYTNLREGNIVEGNNANSVGTLEHRGLVYLCNENLNTVNRDFLIGSALVDDTNIKYYQGLQVDLGGEITYNASGNRFSTSAALNLHGINNDLLEYYYNPSGVNETPLFIAGALLTEIAQENTCPVVHCEPPCKTSEEIALEKIKYYQDTDRRVTAKNEHEAALAFGNTILAKKKEAEASYYRQETDKEAYMVVLHTLYDTVQFNEDTLAIWVENLDIFSADISWALRQQSAGNYAEAIATLDRASNRPNLNEQNKKDLLDMPILMEALQGKSPYEVTSDYFKELEYLSINPRSFTGNIAKNILRLHGYYFAPIYHISPVEDDDKTQNLTTAILDTEKEELSIFPNPNDGQFNLHWAPSNIDSEKAWLEIRDISGRLIHEQPVSANEQISINLSNNISGIYYYQLRIPKQTPLTGKLIFH